MRKGENAQETLALIKDKIKDLESSKQLQDSTFQMKDSSFKQLLIVHAEIEGSDVALPASSQARRHFQRCSCCCH